MRVAHPIVRKLLILSALSPTLVLSWLKHNEAMQKVMKTSVLTGMRSVTEFVGCKGLFGSGERVCEGDAEGMQAQTAWLFRQACRMGTVEQVSEDGAAKSEAMGTVYAELVGASCVRI